MKACLDTNVLLDILIPKRPAHEDSLLVLRLAKERQIELQVSTQSLTDTQYILVKERNSFPVFSEMVRWMLNHINVDGPDSFQLRDAIEGHTGDFEDDLHYAYALDNACDVIITGDRKFIERKKSGDILMMTPEEFVGKCGSNSPTA